MVMTGYATSITMARRGFDLSGDLIGASGNPLELLVFQLGDLVSFGILVGAAVWYRRRPDVHKRLMLLAIMEALMPAALAHIIGHSHLREIKAPIILIPLVMLLFASAVHDRLTQGRIHPVSLWVALALFVWANVPRRDHWTERLVAPVRGLADPLKFSAARRSRRMALGHRQPLFDRRVAVQQEHFDRVRLRVGFVEPGQLLRTRCDRRRGCSCARARSGRIGVRSGG